jgi:hypothetical protein
MQMNDQSGGHRPRPARLGLMGVLLAMAGVVLLAACSSSSDATASGGSSTSSAYAKALAYAQCIRAHGIPNQPDPNSKGQFIIPNGTSNFPGSNVSAAVRDAAAKACQKLLPPSLAQGPPQSQGAKATSQGLKFSACMRSHGVPNFPDPAANGSITLPPGMNAESPQFQAAGKACQSLMPLNPGGSAP